MRDFTDVTAVHYNLRSIAPLNAAAALLRRQLAASPA